MSYILKRYWIINVCVEKKSKITKNTKLGSLRGQGSSPGTRHIPSQAMRPSRGWLAYLTTVVPSVSGGFFFRCGFMVKVLPQSHTHISSVLVDMLPARLMEHPGKATKLARESDEIGILIRHRTLAATSFTINGEGSGGGARPFMETLRDSPAMELASVCGCAFPSFLSFLLFSIHVFFIDCWRARLYLFLCSFFCSFNSFLFLFSYWLIRVCLYFFL